MNDIKELTDEELKKVTGGAFVDESLTKMVTIIKICDIANIVR